MISFGKFIKVEREKKGWSQTEFGALIKINTPAISRIENDKKRFPILKLKQLAELFEIEYTNVSDMFFASMFAKEAFKNGCSDNVFSLANQYLTYLQNINVEQGKLEF